MNDSDELDGLIQAIFDTTGILPVKRTGQSWGEWYRRAVAPHLTFTP